MKKYLYALMMLMSGILAMATSPDAAARRLSDKEIETAIKAYMDECRTNGMAVVMVRGNNIVYQNAFGWK